jgi:hypothetical protein
MAAKPIAVKADVSTEPAQGTSPFTGYDGGGAWTQITVTVLTRPVLRSGGAEVAWKATASFQYAGTVGGNPAPPGGPSTVTLTGSSTTLTAEGQPLLRDGDTAQDSFGNKIKVSAMGPLRSE